MKYLKPFSIKESSSTKKFSIDSSFTDWEKLLDLSKIDEELNDYIEILDLPLITVKSNKLLVNNLFRTINSFSEELLDKPFYINYSIKYKLKTETTWTDDLSPDESIDKLQSYISLLTEIKSLCKRLKDKLGLEKLNILSNLELKEILISVYSNELPKDKVREIFEDCKKINYPLISKLDKVINDLYKKYNEYSVIIGENIKDLYINYSPGLGGNISTIPIGLFFELFDEIIVIGYYNVKTDTFTLDEEEFERSLVELESLSEL